MFNWARSAGLPMLGGHDLYVYHRDASVRAHFWPADQAARNPDEKYVVNATAPLTSFEDRSGEAKESATNW